MGIEPGDPWEDEGYAGEDDWGEESIAADIEEDRPLDNDADAAARSDEAESTRDEKAEADGVP